MSPKNFNAIDDILETQSFKGALKNSFDAPGIVMDTVGIIATTSYEVSQYESKEDRRIVGIYVAGTEIVSSAASAVASASATAIVTKITTTAGTAIMPGVGTAIGLVAGLIVGYGLDCLFGWIRDEYIEDIVENN